VFRGLKSQNLFVAQQWWATIFPLLEKLNIGHSNKFNLATALNIGI